MTELERFAAALLVQWRSDGGTDGEPIVVGALLDKVFPYRFARRTLGIDVSEDYEALVLRLISEEEQLVRTEPLDAAEMAKSTMTSKLPDLDVLQLLRAATISLTSRTIARLEGVLPMPPAREESRWAEPAAPVAAPPREAEAAPATPQIVAVPEALPAERESADVIPLHPTAVPEPEAAPAPAGPPPAFLTTVSFTPPTEESCWSCSEGLPNDRAVKFCPFCGADQRQPACSACGTPVERRWKHCPECGGSLAPRS
jgi:RNA polymerase subunit RPABC4/transcription elongation factor Spt4